MDGVLWRDQNPIGNLEELFNRICLDGIQYTFATNNSTKTRSDYKTRLNNFGVPVEEEDIFTSGTTLVKIISEKYPSGGPIFILGENGLREPLREFGFYHQEKEVLAVVGGLDRQINYEKLKKATLLLQEDIEFFYTNADTSFPTPEGIIPGAGSILRALEAASGKKAKLAGKPKATMFEHALMKMKSIPESTLVIGDRLDTDILGGLNAGCLTAMVLTGISTNNDIEQANYRPHLLFEDLSNLIDHFHEMNWEYEDET